MSWNYRVVKMKEWNTLYCTEVYYDGNKILPDRLQEKNIK